MSGLKESTDERASRLGRNEGVFRAINEEIENLNTTFAASGEQEFGIVCECGVMSCMEQIPIRTKDYARGRTDSTLFFLVRGHDDPTVEVVVEEQHAYVVVKKAPGSPAGIAANATTAK